MSQFFAILSVLCIVEALLVVLYEYVGPKKVYLSSGFILLLASAITYLLYYYNVI